MPGATSPVSGDEKLEFAPVRSLDDFLLHSARFQVPPFKELERWNNRILSNLLYYQSNYGILLLAIFVLIGLFQPKQVLWGCLALALAFAVFAYATSQIPQAVQWKQDHPFLGLCLILVSAYCLLAMFSSVLVFLFAICLPLLMMFLHASTRLRSLKNKVGMKVEASGFKQTPMGRLLRILDIRLDLVSF